MEAEVLMCEVYGPLLPKCYAGFPTLSHLHFPFNLSAPVKLSDLCQDLDHTTSNGGDLEGRKSMSYPGIYMEGVKETTKSDYHNSWCSPRDSNSGITNINEERHRYISLLGGRMRSAPA
jgi:hypothetical protein